LRQAPTVVDVLVEVLVDDEDELLVVPAAGSASTTAATKPSTVASTLPVSPLAIHPPFNSALANADTNLTSAACRHAGSAAGLSCSAAFAQHLSFAAAFLLAAMRLAAAQCRGGGGGRRARLAARFFSAELLLPPKVARSVTL
jgi:hypothetical protein